jgi:hypothetical protein
MARIEMPGESPVIDFDYFHFDDDAYNYKKAEQLAVLLMSHVNIDELHGILFEDEKLWDSTVGTGGSGMNYACPSQGAQRACLASHFSSYAQRQYQSCYLGLPEYECLKDLLTYFEEDYNPAPHREKIQEQNIKLLEQVCRKFEIEYTKEVPGFLFTLLKNQK